MVIKWRWGGNTAGYGAASRPSVAAGGFDKVCPENSLTKKKKVLIKYLPSALPIKYVTIYNTMTTAVVSLYVKLLLKLKKKNIFLVYSKYRRKLYFYLI